MSSKLNWDEMEMFYFKARISDIVDEMRHLEKFYDHEALKHIQTSLMLLRIKLSTLWEICDNHFDFREDEHYGGYQWYCKPAKGNDDETI
jgi:hypothetical protein